MTTDLSTQPDAVDAALIKAGFAHVTRARILHRFTLTADRLSPLELAAQLSEPLGDVAYHVRILATAGLLRSAGGVTRRGAYQHYYRPDPEAITQLENALRLQVDIVAALREAAA